MVIIRHPNLICHWRVRYLKIKIMLFASLRERIGEPEIWLDLEEGESLENLTRSMSNRYPDIGKNLLVAVNGRYVDGNTHLSDGDEVAFFPPVSGG
jgi:molybdopterin converting factor subunit 1